MNAPSATGCRIIIFRLFEPKVDFGAADSCRRGSTSADMILPSFVMMSLITAKRESMKLDGTIRQSAKRNLFTVL